MNIKPCPFCGSNKVSMEAGFYYYQCKDCGCFGPTSELTDFNMQDEIRRSIALDLWNKRNDQTHKNQN